MFEFKLDPVQVASQLLSTAAEAETKQRTQAGIDIPIPFSSRPLKLQVRNRLYKAIFMFIFQIKSEADEDVALAHRQKDNAEPKQVCVYMKLEVESELLIQEEMNREHRVAFQMAKETCLKGTPESCDQVGV